MKGNVIENAAENLVFLSQVYPFSKFLSCLSAPNIIIRGFVWIRTRTSVCFSYFLSLLKSTWVRHTHTHTNSNLNIPTYTQCVQNLKIISKLRHTNNINFLVWWNLLDLISCGLFSTLKTQEWRSMCVCVCSVCVCIKQALQPLNSLHRSLEKLRDVVPVCMFRVLVNFHRQILIIYFVVVCWQTIICISRPMMTH